MAEEVAAYSAGREVHGGGKDDEVICDLQGAEGCLGGGGNINENRERKCFLLHMQILLRRSGFPASRAVPSLQKMCYKKRLLRVAACAGRESGRNTRLDVYRCWEAG